ncbi:2-dehydropantoate 2-reductase [Filobacillus milosensis]|uniref:2-dehydropantoate 2-reductase n=1 Tax=Filobacillus milosensis TaxID=94137 RepID=A0A4Y8IPB4_9BACI|nr:2-dehydropantoate 2-reductase [Filobacillus milosensis]TFB23309.1 2-dehydropantoate 2-reductase [Filobacillus milosensis]
MNIGVIGLGSVGLFVASQLSESHNVTGYCRRDRQRQSILKNGILVDQKPFHIDVELVENIKKHDLLIICVKQPHIDNLLPVLKEVSETTTFLFLQNGLGHIEKVSVELKNILVGTCDYGISKLEDHSISLKGAGLIRIASVADNNDIAIRTANQLSRDVINVEFASNLSQVLHEKLIVNSVINPLTALFEVKNGEILTNDYLKDIAHQLSHEAALAMKIDSNHAWSLVQKVASQTKENHSSMLKDIQQNKQTEIDYINGFILKQSQETLPSHSLIYQLIKAKENI